MKMATRQRGSLAPDAHHFLRARGSGIGRARVSRLLRSCAAGWRAAAPAAAPIAAQPLCRRAPSQVTPGPAPRAPAVQQVRAVWLPLDAGSDVGGIRGSHRRLRHGEAAAAVAAQQGEQPRALLRARAVARQHLHRGDTGAAANSTTGHACRPGPKCSNAIPGCTSPPQPSGQPCLHIASVGRGAVEALGGPHAAPLDLGAVRVLWCAAVVDGGGGQGLPQSTLSRQGEQTVHQRRQRPCCIHQHVLPKRQHVGVTAGNESGARPAEPLTHPGW